MKKRLRPLYICFLLIGFSLARDNSKFIDQSFWNTNPSTGEIINALYGSGASRITAYTRYRSGGNSCDPASMSVIYVPAFNVNSGNYFSPLSLAANTIYVLESGKHITTGYIYANTCSALIGKGKNTTLHSTVTLGGGQGTILASNKKNFVCESIGIDGKFNGTTGYHDWNYAGLSFWYNSFSNTVNNVKGYNSYMGIEFYSDVSYHLISNSQFFNTRLGISPYLGTHNLINNSQFFNNEYGINISFNSHYNTINNSQAYNNSSFGIVLGGNGNVIHNTISYNNSSHSILIGGTGNIIHDALSFNNSYEGLGISNSGQLYYGNNDIFGNGIVYTSLPGDTLLGGNNTDLLITQVGRSGGIILTGRTVSWGLFTNPKNTFGKSLLMNGLFSTLRDQKNRTGTSNLQYFYGARIPKQQQPVMRSGDLLVPYGIAGTDWNSEKPIALLVGDIGGTLNCLPILVPGTNTGLCFTQPEFYGSMFSGNQIYGFSLPRDNLDGNLSNQSFKFLHHQFTLPSVSQGESSEFPIKVKMLLDALAQ